MADLKGLKRICMSCGARFYDLNKKPIVCPTCAVEFTGEIKVKARRGRIADVEAQVDDAVVADEVEEEEVEVIEADDETVSLEDIEEDSDDLDDDEALVALEDDLEDIEDLEELEEEVDEEEEK